MEGLNEHLKLSKGNEIVVQKISTDSFLHRDMWGRIDEIVEDYAKVNPMEMEIIVRQNAQIASGQFRKHGASTKDGIEFRHRLRMPISLLRTLETFCPELFENRDNYHKFMKRYKGLCAYE